MSTEYKLNVDPTDDRVMAMIAATLATTNSAEEAPQAIADLMMAAAIISEFASISSFNEFAPLMERVAEVASEAGPVIQAQIEQAQQEGLLN